MQASVDEVPARLGEEVAIRYPNMPPDNRVQQAIANPAGYFAEAWVRARDEVMAADRQEAEQGLHDGRRNRARAILRRASELWHRSTTSGAKADEPAPEARITHPEPRGGHSA